MSSFPDGVIDPASSAWKALSVSCLYYLVGGPQVTNIRNTSSPHWRGWLKPENRCLIPANSFAEYAPEPNPETKKNPRIAGQRNRRLVIGYVPWW